MNYWLMKSEPDVFSIDDLAARPGQREPWDGVRNYQARNFMHDDMKKGDRVLFYHSSCAEPGVAGLARVVREAYPDATALDPESPYYDPKSSADAPRWVRVDIEFVRKFDRVLTLAELKQDPRFAGMTLLKRGNRLSIMPVAKAHFDAIVAMGLA